MRQVSLNKTISRQCNDAKKKSTGLLLPPQKFAFTLAIFSNNAIFDRVEQNNAFLSVKPSSDKGNQMGAPPGRPKVHTMTDPLEETARHQRTKHLLPPQLFHTSPSPTLALSLGHELMASAAGQKLTVPPAARLKRFA